MGTITAQSIIDQVEQTLNDLTNITWGESELLAYLNDGQRQIVALKPESYAVTENKLCVAGTKQSLPATGIRLLGHPRNMGTDGSTAGRAITRVLRSVIDQFKPTWHTDTASAEVKHVIYEPEVDPKVFYVYPPQPAVSPGYLEIAYSAAPSNVAAIANAITLDDVYANPLRDYIFFRAYSKEFEGSPISAQKAAAYWQMFLQSLGLQNQAEEAKV